MNANNARLKSIMNTTTRDTIHSNDQKIKADSPENTTKSIFNTSVSLLTNIYKPDRLDTITIEEALDKIQGGMYKNPVEQARKFKAMGRTDSYEKKKKKLPGITFVGTFRERRANKNFQEHSGFAIIDLDNVGNVPDVKDRLCEDRHVAACFISPGGQGLKVLVRTPYVNNDAEYKRILPLLKDYYENEYDGVKIDFGKDGKDVSRLCFVSYDPDLHRNEHADIFPIPDDILHPPEPKPSTVEAPDSGNDGHSPHVEKLEYRWLEQAKATATKFIQDSYPPLNGHSGNRHYNRLRAARLLGGVVTGFAKDIFTHEDARKFLEQLVKQNTTLPLEKAMKDINDALVNGENDPITTKQKLDDRQQWLEQHFTPLPEQKGERPEPDQAPPDWCFWTPKTNHNGLQIGVNLIPSKYLEFLIDLNFRIFMRRGQPVVVRETTDSMEYTTERGRINTDVKQCVLEKLKEAGYPEVIDALLLNSKYFTLDVLEMLPEIDKEKVRYSLFRETDTQITLTTPLVNEHPIIAYGDIKLLCPGTTLAIVGRQGLGKTTVCEMFASLALNPTCEPENPFTVQIDKDILWVDTENPTQDLIHTIHRVKKRTQAEKNNLLTEDHVNFKRLRLDKYKGVDDKMTQLLEYLEEYKPPIGLLILDGALDLVVSMNDEAEAKRVYNDIERITTLFDCGVILTVHSGPLDKTGKGMGHIGSIVMRKCSAYLQIRSAEEDREIKELSTNFDQAKVRSGKDWGVYAAMKWDEVDHMFHFIDYTPPEQPEKTSQQDKIEAALKSLFTRQRYFTYTNLRKAYMEQTKKSQRTADRHIEIARDEMHFLSLENDFYVLTQKDDGDDWFRE